VTTRSDSPDAKHSRIENALASVTARATLKVADAILGVEEIAVVAMHGNGSTDAEGNKRFPGPAGGLELFGGSGRVARRLVQAV
jgi:hypothetical protein